MSCRIGLGRPLVSVSGLNHAQRATAADVSPLLESFGIGAADAFGAGKGEARQVGVCVPANPGGLGAFSGDDVEGHD